MPTITAAFDYNGNMILYQDNSNIAARNRAINDLSCCGIIHFQQYNATRIRINYIFFFTQNIVDITSGMATSNQRAPVHPSVIGHSFVNLVNHLGIDEVQGFSWISPPRIRGWRFSENYYLYPFTLLIWIPMIFLNLFSSFFFNYIPLSRTISRYKFIVGRRI